MNTIEYKYGLGTILEIGDDVLLVDSVRKTLGGEIEYMLTDTLTRIKYWRTEKEVDTWLSICGKLGKTAIIHDNLEDLNK